MTRKKLRMLLAESQHGETAQAVRALYPESEGDLDMTVVSTVATLLATIKVVEPEIILLDLGLSLREPLDAVHLVHRTAPGVPLIVFTDPANKENAARSLSEGAMDYLLKGYMDTKTLDRVLRAALERNTMKALTDLLRDPVTELYTHDGFITVGTRRMEEAHRTESPLVLICGLFENLETFRNGFGPATADRALSDFAGILRGSCRRSDVVGRLSEATFAMLAVDAVAPSAEVIRKRLEQHVVVYNRTRSPWAPIELRTSVGAWSPKDQRSFSEFVDSVEIQLRLVPAETAGPAAG